MNYLLFVNTKANIRNKEAQLTATSFFVKALKPPDH